MLQISDHTIRLSEIRKNDITYQFVDWLNDAEVVKYSQQRHIVHSVDTSNRYLESFEDTDNLYLKILIRPNDRPIGSVTVYFNDNGENADIGILIGEKDLWGKGYGLKTWCLIMNYLFEERNVKAVSGGCDIRNIGMIRIFEKAGMTRLFDAQSHDGTTVRYIRHT